MTDYKKYVVHCKKDKFDVYIGRPSKWGNPFTHRGGTAADIIVESREEAIQCFKNYIMATPWLLEAAKAELKGKILGCWCSPQDCHGEVLAEIANSGENMDTIEVVALHTVNGPEGTGWYVYEKEYPEEGYVWFYDSKPSQEDIEKINPTYVLEDLFLHTKSS